MIWPFKHKENRASDRLDYLYRRAQQLRERHQESHRALNIAITTEQWDRRLLEQATEDYETAEKERVMQELATSGQRSARKTRKALK